MAGVNHHSPLIEVEIMRSKEMDQFQFDLTDAEKRLCDWVARQARAGVLRIRYEDARAALDVPDEQLTRILRDMRERLDGIHEMVESPIVNTRTPYFDVSLQARCIWDDYCHAEQETTSPLSVQNVAQQFTVSC